MQRDDNDEEFDKDHYKRLFGKLIRSIIIYDHEFEYACKVTYQQDIRRHYSVYSIGKFHKEMREKYGKSEK